MVAGGSGLGGKTMAGNGEGTPALGSMALGAHGTPFALPNSSFNFGSPAFTFTSPNASGAGSTSIDALTGFTNPAASYSGMEGGTSMGMSLSSFGINLMGPSMSSTGSAAGKTDDAERKRRLEVIIDTIGRRPGRISREGLERLGRKCGLDTQMGEVDDLAMAGKNILVDVGISRSRHSSYEVGKANRIHVVRIRFESLAERQTRGCHSRHCCRCTHGTCRESRGNITTRFNTANERRNS